ncbi:hypothetical protein F2P81_013128 [Scophthalmus maximus]|uniref:Uncharacterized protein n=1 Tax=Scophthalmus maximus TaxID=52904 RepID=A0A6A4SU08_SCOMX|nr:hypothetical protein F2P81_013128 [Scophthalmus maximus]
MKRGLKKVDDIANHALSISSAIRHDNDDSFIALYEVLLATLFNKATDVWCFCVHTLAVINMIWSTAELESFYDHILMYCMPASTSASALQSMKPES